MDRMGESRAEINPGNKKASSNSVFIRGGVMSLCSQLCPGGDLLPPSPEYWKPPLGPTAIGISELCLHRVPIALQPNRLHQEELL